MMDFVELPPAEGKKYARVIVDMSSKWEYACAYLPQCGGAVERENGTLKSKLAKCCEETGLP